MKPVSNKKPGPRPPSSGPTIPEKGKKKILRRPPMTEGYRKLGRAVRKPGAQPGVLSGAAQRIMKRTGMSEADAMARIKDHLARGIPTGGIKPTPDWKPTPKPGVRPRPTFPQKPPSSGTVPEGKPVPSGIRNRRRPPVVKKG